MLCQRKLNLFFFILLTTRLYVAQDIDGFHIDPNPAVAHVGKEFLLTCVYPSSVADVKFKDPTGNIFSKGQNNIIQLVEDSLSLTLSNPTLKSGGVYTCQGRINDTEEIVETNRSVTVIDPLRFVDVQQSQDFELGETAKVVCKVAGYPKGKLYWKKGNLNIDHDPTNRMYVNQSTSELIIKNIEEGDEAVYTCLSIESTYNQFKSKQISVVVEVSPKHVVIKGSNRAIEGQNAILHCNASADPAPNYFWYHKGNGEKSRSTFISDGVEKNGTLILNKVNLNNTGQYTCVASNKRGNASNTILFDVYALPRVVSVSNDTVRNGSSALLRCVATGVPLPDLYIYHNTTELKKNVTQTAANNTTILELSLSRVSSADSGSYNCKASNNYGTDFKQVYLQVRRLPCVFEATNDRVIHQCLNQTAALTCNYEAYPPAVISWTRLTSISTGSETVPENKSPTNQPDSENVTFVPITSAEYFRIENRHEISTLYVKLSSDDLYGEYKCKAENDEGSSSAVIRLVRPNPPPIPHIIKVSEITTTSVSLGFSLPESQFDSMASFNLKLTSSNGMTSTRSFMPNETTPKFKYNNARWYKIIDLHSNTEYSAAVSAINCIGEGNQSTPYNFSTKSDQISISSKALSSFPNIYFLSWNIPKNEYLDVERIAISVLKKEGDNLVRVDNYTVKSSDDAFAKQSFAIRNLTASTEYNIQVTSFGKTGSRSANFNFTTANEPSSSYASETTHRSIHEENGNSARIIIIISVVVFFIFIFIDIFFAIRYHCGLFYLIFDFCCSSSTNNEAYKNTEKEIPNTKNGDEIDQRALLKSKESTDTNSLNADVHCEEEEIQMKKFEKQPIA